MVSVGHVETTSDGTLVYTYEQALEVFQTLKVRKFTISDLVLVILGAQDKPVHGKTLLMKELFLLHKEVIKDASSNPRFVKGRLGPHSWHIENALRMLHEGGVLDRRRFQNSSVESFQLTPKGVKMAEKVLRKMYKSDQRLVSSKRKGWDQLGERGALNYIYTKYPEYKKLRSEEKS